METIATSPSPSSATAQPASRSSSVARAEPGRRPLSQTTRPTRAAPAIVIAGQLAAGGSYGVGGVVASLGNAPATVAANNVAAGTSHQRNRRRSARQAG